MYLLLYNFTFPCTIIALIKPFLICFGTGIQSTFQDSLEFLKNFKPNAKKKKSWTSRQYEKEEKWREQRQLAFDSLLEREVGKKCFKCGALEPKIYCHECSYFLCHSCDSEVHLLSAFHNRKAMLGGFLRPISPCETLSSAGEIEIEGM